MTRKIFFSFIGSTLLFFILLITCSNTNNINKKSIVLRWKLSQNDTLRYKTVMNEIGESSFQLNLGGLFDTFTKDSISNGKSTGKDFFNKLQHQFNDTQLSSILTRSQDFENVIDIAVVVDSDEKEDEISLEDDEDEVAAKLQKMMNSMMKGTMLRGSIHTDGSLHSFWVKSNQKNLLSVFFELPNTPISKGDTWTLDNVNLISNDQNFICREAKKKNTITLTDIKEINGETIAVIDYDILEYVSGDFNAPTLHGTNGTRTTMEFVYKAQGEFSLDKGKWVSYNGILSFDASGIMESKQKKKFALIEQ